MMTIDRSTLPASVRRWLDCSSPSDAPIPRKISNTQEGEIDIRGKWTPFAARTCYQRRPFTFVWKARVKLGPGVWVIAEDGHDDEGGWGGSKLWGIIPMGGRTDPEVFAMQLVRSLAELPWTPQFALALPELEWQDTSDTTFTVRTTGIQEVSVSFELDGDGDIIRASGKRYYDVSAGFARAPWHYDFSDHRNYDGVRIPTSAVAAYDKPDGQWVYWRGKITSVVSEP